MLRLLLTWSIFVAIPTLPTLVSAAPAPTFRPNPRCFPKNPVHGTWQDVRYVKGAVWYKTEASASIIREGQSGYRWTFDITTSGVGTGIDRFYLEGASDTGGTLKLIETSSDLYDSGKGTWEKVYKDGKQYLILSWTVSLGNQERYSYELTMVRPSEHRKITRSFTDTAAEGSDTTFVALNSGYQDPCESIQLCAYDAELTAEPDEDVDDGSSEICFDDGATGTSVITEQELEQPRQLQQPGQLEFENPPFPTGDGQRQIIP